ncbi:MAG TPA: NADH-quinone oxidoreductase subunit G [Actinomycetota bacterium]|nr:NADH-quinone oxidoreductase subunit G [Actinomycetota bacterium]
MSPAPDTVTLAIDGKEVTVPKGTLIIRAAEQLGMEIPRFCEHPLLDPIGACRQCYVEIEGQRKLFTSCTTEAADGMAVHTQNTSEEAHEAQIANLEFLLINHPLDCPICDRGGECPLQDQTMAYGPGESRYVEPKRTYEKPVPLSSLVLLDRERCVLCTRCTRFCDQISGDRFIEMFERGAGQQVAIAAGEDLRSPFSGNTIQICPVGALTASTYRFVARPFDIHSADGVCAHCSAGCNMKVDLRRGQVVRTLARDNLQVNDAWLCDKGRFAFRSADARDRITTPLIRARGLEPAPFHEVFERIGEWSRGKRVAFLAGGRLTDEDAYALSKLARTVFGTNDLDHRRHLGGGHAERLTAASPLEVTYRDVERAPVIVVVGLDAEQEVPILHLRVRKAVHTHGARVVVIGPRPTRLRDLAQHVPCLPGEEAHALERLVDADDNHDELGAAAAALRAAGPNAVVLAGPRVADVPISLDLVMRQAGRVGARACWVSRRAGDRGALRAGVHPELLPGGRRVTEAEERAEVEAVWGELSNTERGADAHRILEDAAARRIEVLFLIGVDPLHDFPDAALALHALRNVPYKVVQDLGLGQLEPFADAFLPAAAPVEKDGHFSTWEGRPQRTRPVRDPQGLSRPDWEIFAGLAQALGHDLGFGSLDELREELGGLLAPREVRAPDPGYLFLPPVERSEKELILFSYPLLVDEGRLSVDATELKAALEEEAFVEVHPGDAERLGLVEGARAVVRTEAADVELPVRVDAGLAEGSCFVPFHQPGLAANVLLTGRFSVPATLEPVTAQGEGAA